MNFESDSSISEKINVFLDRVIIKFQKSELTK